MANNKPLVLDDIVSPESLACRISEKYQEWETLRNKKVSEWKETQEYIFATDTTTTSNGKLPWSNKTTIPKLCQIRDNLHSNYMATLFPKRAWMRWEGETEKDEDLRKKETIQAYMNWVVDRREFYNEASKLVLDYIDYGNVFATVEWQDTRNETKNALQGGYVGPTIKRISPLDIVFNPIAPSFHASAKIIRTFVTRGELKEMILRESVGDQGEREEALKLWNYLSEVRAHVSNYTKGTLEVKNRIFDVSGFTDFRSYLEGDYVEILTFYGDIYDECNDEYLKNHIITVVDRHKIVSKRVNPSLFGYAPIFHVGWRVRPDNLWAMGPLDNLVGMQYRIDHLENMKADVFDLLAYPMLKIRGYVEDFELGPLERIYVGDEGDVEIVVPPFQILQVDNQVAVLEMKMEEMAGSPREAMGIRSPGEKTKYEVQVLENATGRIFQNKTAQFERDLLEDLLNAMLELAKRNTDSATIRVFDDELKISTFSSLNRDDLLGVGRIKPIAARHFAEQANMLQNLTQFFSTPAGQDPRVTQHFSGEKLARLYEALLDLEPYRVVEAYVAISENADAQRLSNVSEEKVMMETATATGMNGDFDIDQ